MKKVLFVLVIVATVLVAGYAPAVPQGKLVIYKEVGNGKDVGYFLVNIKSAVATPISTPKYAELVGHEGTNLLFIDNNPTVLYEVNATTGATTTFSLPTDLQHQPDWFRANIVNGEIYLDATAWGDGMVGDFNKAASFSAFHLKGDSYEKLSSIDFSTAAWKDLNVMYVWSNHQEDRVIMLQYFADRNSFLSYDPKTGIAQPLSLGFAPNLKRWIDDFSPDGNSFTYGGYVGNLSNLTHCYGVRNTITGRDAPTYCIQHLINQVEWSPNGGSVAIVSNAEEMNAYNYDTLKRDVTIVDFNAPGHPVVVHLVGVTDLAWSPDSSELAVICNSDESGATAAPNEYPPTEVRIINRSGTTIQRIPLDAAQTFNLVSWIR